jgi:hypothetical protein
VLGRQQAHEHRLAVQVRLAVVGVDRALAEESVREGARVGVAAAEQGLVVEELHGVTPAEQHRALPEETDLDGPVGRRRPVTLAPAAVDEAVPLAPQGEAAVDPRMGRHVVEQVRPGGRLTHGGVLTREHPLLPRRPRKI